MPYGDWLEEIKKEKELKYEDKPIEDWYVTPEQKHLISTIDARTTRYIVDPKGGKKPLLVIEGYTTIYHIRTKVSPPKP